MKTKILKSTSLVLLLFLSTLTAKAQIGELRNNLSIGANVGINLNSVMFTPTIKQNTFIAPNFGLTFRYISEKYFAMICGAQLEVNFAQRGWDENFDDQPNNSYKRTLNYIEIPFLAHLAFGKDKGNGVQVFIHAGPQIGFLMSDKETYSKDFEATSRVTYQYGKKVTNKFDYGIAGGLGLELKNRKAGNFILEGRYYFALSDMYGNTKKDFFDRSAHSIISIKFTYLFDLLK